MLRRRILASAMASVMAIGSVAVVASAEDTAASTSMVKSKADLEAYVKSFDKFREDEIYDYGTTAGEEFLNTLEFAENVVLDDKATVDDYTAAYLMLKSVRESLKHYTAEELKVLIEGATKKYNGQNIMNEEIGDLIYDEGKFSDFATAYEEAESVVTSGDSRLITDAYYVLKNAIAAVEASAKTVITKAQFRTALKKYESIIDNASDYDNWRRGSLSGWFDNGGVTGNYWVFNDLMGSGKGTFGDVKTVTLGNGVINGTTIIDIGTYTTVQDYITTVYGKLDDEKTVTKTTNDDYVKAYKVALNAAEIFEGFVADNTTRASKASAEKILDQYHKQLVAKYRKTTCEDLYQIVNGEAPAAGWDDSGNAYYGAELKNNTARKTVTTPDGDEVTIAKGVSLLKYVKMDSSYVDAADTKLLQAMEIYEAYLTGDYSRITELDETGKITKATGSVAEWTLIYRALKYALDDMFNGKAGDFFTKAQVSELINKAYDLAEATGDAQIFHDEHMALVDVRQAALDWIRAANKDKTYKDGKEIDGATSTDVYKAVKSAYDALEKKLSFFQYSYGEIFYKIAEVADKIENDELDGTESMLNALKDCSIALATLDATDEIDLTGDWTPNAVPADNEAYTTDRVFLPYNRLFTRDGDGSMSNANSSEKALKAAYETLLAEIKKQDEPEVKLGDVDGNGLVNALDAAEILKKVVAGESIDAKVGDVDGNGTVNALDAAQILKNVVAG